MKYWDIWLVFRRKNILKVYCLQRNLLSWIYAQNFILYFKKQIFFSEWTFPLLMPFLLFYLSLCLNKLETILKLTGNIDKWRITQGHPWYGVCLTCWPVVNSLKFIDLLLRYLHLLSRHEKFLLQNFKDCWKIKSFLDMYFVSLMIVKG